MSYVEWTDPVIQMFIQYCRDRGGDARPLERFMDGTVTFEIRQPTLMQAYPEGRKWSKELVNQFVEDYNDGKLQNHSSGGDRDDAANLASRILKSDLERRQDAEAQRQ